MTGVVPPLVAAEWQAEFAKYQAIPQYRAIHAGMTLGDFKVIFFWEYLHRLWGRLIGFVFAVPLPLFPHARPHPARGSRWPLAGIFALGGSGLARLVHGGERPADRIEVSQYRLAAHLALAVVIYAAMLWVALDLLDPPAAWRALPRARRALAATLRRAWRSSPSSRWSPAGSSPGSTPGSPTTPSR